MRNVFIITVLLCLLFVGKSFATKSYSFVQAKLVKTVAVKHETIEDDIIVEALVIRDEKVVQAPNAGIVEYLMQEGERVRVGTQIAEVVDEAKKLHYDRQVADIERQLKKINEAAAQRINVLQSEIDSLNFKIRTTAEEIAKNADNTEQSSAQAQELQSLLKSKAQLVAKLNAENAALERQKQPLVQEKDKLTEYYHKVAVKLTAPAAGIVCLQYDGLENKLTPAMITKLSVADINNTEATNNLLVNGVKIAKDQPVFKVVNNFEAYLAVVVPKSIGNELVKKAQISYRLIGDQGDKTRVAQKAVTKEQGSSMLLVLKDTSIGDLLLGQRKAKIAIIGAKFYGATVPQSAVITEKGRKGVYIVQNGKARFQPVEIRLTDTASGMVGVEELQEGCRVIINPAKVKDGQRIDL